MSGHSKWSNIKRKKEKTDVEKAKIFTKIGRELAVAVKEGGSADPAINSKLRDCIIKARENNVPNDNINRIIKKAASSSNNETFERVIYEGYGPGGVAVIVSCLTDNRNRTAGDLRHYFDKCGGNLGEPGCVSYLFKKKGIILLDKPESMEEEAFLSDIFESESEDYKREDENTYRIITAPEQFENVKKYLLNKGHIIGSAELEMTPISCVNIEKEKLDQLKKLFDLLYDDDDVQDIYNNCSNFNAEF